MSDTNWNEEAEYLMRTRGLYLNDDYLEFLVSKVWKLNRPAAVVDFGCGFGYVGLKLLPLLPAGSSYTGLDLATSLLEKGRELFAGSPYSTRFVEMDVTSADLGAPEYDIAICHAVLMHMADPVAVLSRMKRCVKPGGLVICFEAHRLGAMASYYHGGRQSEYVNLGILQNLYEEAAQRTGKDGNIGIKLPVFMDEVGLTEIECRRSDKVNVLLTGQEPEQKARMTESLRWDGLGVAPRESAEAFRQKLVVRGLSPEQADAQYAAECASAARYKEEDLEVVWACGMVITSGRVPA